MPGATFPGLIRSGHFRKGGFDQIPGASQPRLIVHKVFPDLAGNPNNFSTAPQACVPGVRGCWANDFSLVLE